MISKLNKDCSQKNIDEALNLVKNIPQEVVSHIYNDAKVNNFGLLKGVPIVMKDNFASIDSTTSASSKILKNFKPLYEATIVTLLKNAGATIVAKTHLDEFAMGGTGLYSYAGKILNPINNEYLVGGSSSGSAYMMHYDAIGAATASDTGDSARKPASYVGKVGYKPTYGSVSRYGMFAYASSLDTVSWITHNVYDAAIMAQVLIKKDDKDFTSIQIPFNLKNITPLKPKKIGFFIDDTHFHQQIQSEFNSFLKVATNKNVIVEKINLDEQYIDAILPTYKVISYAEATSNLANETGIIFGTSEDGNTYQEIMRHNRSSNFAYMVQRRITMGAYFLKNDHQKDFFLRAQKVRRVLANIWTKYLKKYDIVIFPAQSNETPLLSDEDKISKERGNPYNDLMLLDNFLGSPSMAIPFSYLNKMPYGINICANFGKDEKLFSHALWLEKMIKDFHD